MPKKEIDKITIVGIICIALLVIFFIYAYFVSVPRDYELKVYSSVRVPSVTNDDVEKAMGQLNKSNDLPIEISPLEIGKDNPYF